MNFDIQRHDGRREIREVDHSLPLFILVANRVNFGKRDTRSQVD